MRLTVRVGELVVHVDELTILVGEFTILVDEFTILVDEFTILVDVFTIHVHQYMSRASVVGAPSERPCTSGTRMSEPQTYMGPEAGGDGGCFRVESVGRSDW